MITGLAAVGATAFVLLYVVGMTLASPLTLHRAAALHVEGPGGFRRDFAVRLLILAPMMWTVVAAYLTLTRKGFSWPPVIMLGAGIASAYLLLLLPVVKAPLGRVADAIKASRRPNRPKTNLFDQT